MLDKTLDKYTDEELLDFIAKRTERNLLPKIRKQIKATNKMLELCKELEKNAFERGPEYGYNTNLLAIVQIQKQLESFLEDLISIKKSVINRTVDKDEYGQEQA